jgi:DNA mismatch repair ATPase MutS
VERRTAILRTPTRTSGDIVEAVYQYLRIYFLLDVTTFYWTAKSLRSKEGQLKELYVLVGTVDALLSAASYRAGMEMRCLPDLSDGAGDLYLDSLVHPLVPEPVPNTIRLHAPGAIITGSNMAGKSTFLRAMGLNAILAQSICVAHANAYRGGFYAVMSSISIEDDLATGKSFYFAEAERLLQLTRSCEGSHLPVLCVIDELLSGTNTLERVHASVAILEYLAKRKCRTIIATHDLEVADELDGRYPCYHFSERAGETGLEFDYLLHPGIVSRTNGIRLLTVLGFPKDIVETARMRVERDGRHRSLNEAKPHTGT